jgi:hypothetical protein
VKTDNEYINPHFAINHEPAPQKKAWLGSFSEGERKMKKADEHEREHERERHRQGEKVQAPGIWHKGPA